MPEHVPTALDVWATQPFQSRAEEIEAFRSARYSDPNDQAYRDAVAAKLSITSFPDQPTTRVLGGAMSSDPKANLGPMQLVVTHDDFNRFQQLADERRNAEQQRQLAVENERRLASTLKIPDLHKLDTSRPAKPFATRADMVMHMSDPRYSRDETFRRYVESRVASSDFSGTTE